MKNEIMVREINYRFHVLCTDPKALEDINYGALSEAIVIAFTLGEINVEELRYLNDAAREAYLSH